MGVRANDPLLEPVAEKVVGGERLTKEDALLLFQTSDLLGVGAMANLANRRLNNSRVFFSGNHHFNPTIVCILRMTCVFCSFARLPKEVGAYTGSLD